MCGICGMYNPGGLPAEANDQIGAMTASLRHRGPDAEGLWIDRASGIALGHRRLAVLDPSPLGAQPMRSRDGRFVVTYNGEIYNAADLRAELEKQGRTFRGGSDTEVLLEVIARYGVERGVVRCEGMFAFAVWDCLLRSLHLARDRAGEKPLYYGRHGSTFAFASELSALRHLPGMAGEVDPDAVALYLRHKSIPAPLSIFRGISKLLPGTTMYVRGAVEAQPRSYWSAPDVAEWCESAPMGTDDADLEADLERLLGDAVGRQIRADVPLGAFLSGGVDSALVVALMQERSPRPVKRFTVGFAEAAYDEAPAAREVARRLGTDHTELYVSAADALDLVPRLPEIYDEPFSDASQIPTCLVAELARREVTVCLSGEGGDELFGGYDHYRWASRAWRLMVRTPPVLRRMLSLALASPTTQQWDRLLSPVGRPWRVGRKSVGLRLHQAAELLSANSPEEALRWFVTDWRSEAAGPSSDGARRVRGRSPRLSHAANRMMFEDFSCTLPTDILTKVDRAAMAVGLEGRMPLLDPRVIEFAWRLPPHLRSGRRGKEILRRLLGHRLPPTLVDRPKQGFCAPIDGWLRGPLRGWAEELLSSDKLRGAGLFNVGAVRRRWQEHVAEDNDWRGDLWSVLMLQAWLERNGPPETPPVRETLPDAHVPSAAGSLQPEALTCDISP